MIIYIPGLVALIGLLIYALTSSTTASGAKVQEIGHILFSWGTLVTLFELAGHVIKVLP